MYNGFRTEQVPILSHFKRLKIFQQLGHNGRNVLDHVFPLDEESVLKIMDAMDWNMKNRIVRMLMPTASNNSPIHYQKVVK